MIYFGFDAGSTRNASALVGVHEEAREWTIIATKRWQGTSERPLDHTNVVGPEAARIVLSFGATSWMIDAFEQGPMRLVSARFGLVWRIQGGELFDVYQHARSVIHDEGHRMCVADDVDPADDADIRAGLIRIQAEVKGGKTRVWLPEQGLSHFDLTSAFLRAMCHGKAGLETSQGHAVSVGANSYAAQSRGGAWYPTPGY